MQFSFCKTRSLSSLKSICQVTKLSVSNGFSKIELAKPNGGPGRYFFMCFFSSRRPLRRGMCGDVSVARRTTARADFVSRSRRRHVWRGFFARRTAARGETLCREEESEADRDFVSRYVAMKVSPIWREEESKTRGRSKTAREAKMPSILPHLSTLPKCKIQMQNHLIPKKLVKASFDQSSRL